MYILIGDNWGGHIVFMIPYRWRDLTKYLSMYSGVLLN